MALTQVYPFLLSEKFSHNQIPLSKMYWKPSLIASLCFVKFFSCLLCEIYFYTFLPSNLCDAVSKAMMAAGFSECHSSCGWPSLLWDCWCSVYRGANISYCPEDADFLPNHFLLSGFPEPTQMLYDNMVNPTFPNPSIWYLMSKGWNY